MNRTSFAGLALGAMLVTDALAFNPDLVEPGEAVQEGLSVQISREGFVAIGDAMVEVLPGLIPADLLPSSDISAGPLQISNLRVQLGVSSVEIVPQSPSLSPSGQPRPGALLEMSITATIGLNDANEPATFDDGLPSWLSVCSGTGYVRPFGVTLPVDVSVRVTRAGQPGATVPKFVVAFDVKQIAGSMSAADINISNCGIASILPALQGPLLQTGVRPIITDALNATVAPLLEDALGALQIEEEFDLLGSALRVSLEPKQVMSSPAGMDIRLTTLFDADQAQCIEDVDPGGVDITDYPVPDPSTLGVGMHFGAHVSDEMANQALYAVFRSGAMCFEVDDELLSGFPLDSSLITLLGGDGYRDILPKETKPLQILTKPMEVPKVVYDGPHDVDIEVRRLGINMYSELDNRIARIVALEADVDAGVDLYFDGLTGELEVDLDFAPQDIRITMVPDVLVEGSEAGIVNGLQTVIDNLLDSLLADVLDGLVFGLPAFEGLGLQSIQANASGPGRDWLTVKGQLGTVDYGEGGGCDGDDGGDGCGGGCDSGCSFGGSTLPGLLGVFLPLWALRRRRG